MAVCPAVINLNVKTDFLPDPECDEGEKDYTYSKLIGQQAKYSYDLHVRSDLEIYKEKKSIQRHGIHVWIRIKIDFYVKSCHTNLGKIFISLPMVYQ